MSLARSSRLVALAVAAVLVLVAAACTHDRTSTIHLASPGDCTPVDIAADPATATLLTQIATRFNDSPAARLGGGGCAFARVVSVDSAVAVRELATRWPHSDVFGPAPVVWVPASSAWRALLNGRLAAAHKAEIAPAGAPLARTPLVIAMPAPMARALGAPAHRIGWVTLARMAADPRGWGARGHPEWGPFRLGLANPNWSTPALDATVAIYSSPATARAAATLQRSVVYYSDSAQVYLDNWTRLGAKHAVDQLRYLSAVVADERAVTAYNASTKSPLVAITPDDGTIESDNPLVVLRVPWSTPAAAAGARAFASFARGRDAQSRVAAAGFRPATAVVGGQRASGGLAPADVERALGAWQRDRRPARVLVLFDVSDSMGDPADGVGGATKLELARPALAAAVAEFAPCHDVGVRIFTTKLAARPSPNWSDVAPLGAYGSQRTRLLRTISELRPRQGSPLYAATRDAYDAIARGADPNRINAVVLLTDGYNEVDRDNNLAALLAHLGAKPNVFVFPIAFSNDADLSALRKMAQVTNARLSDARDTSTLTDAFARVFASF